MNRPNYYDILGLTTLANKDEIKSAYRKLAQRYHPDKNVLTQNDVTLFIIINNAYQVLVNDLSRDEYDSYLHKIKNKRYSPLYTFKGHDPLIEKALSEFNYILWDIEDIIHNITEEYLKEQINGETPYSQTLNLFKSIEEGILEENDRYRNFINKKIEKRNIETYFYQLRIEVQKHIENISKESIKMEIEQLMNIKNSLISFVSQMHRFLNKAEITNKKMD
jgi:DnaJ-class molecular chaperone